MIPRAALSGSRIQHRHEPDCPESVLGFCCTSRCLFPGDRVCVPVGSGSCIGWLGYPYIGGLVCCVFCLTAIVDYDGNNEVQTRAAPIIVAVPPANANLATVEIGVMEHNKPNNPGTREWKHGTNEVELTGNSSA